jgi:hypothetical protein
MLFKNTNRIKKMIDLGMRPGLGGVQDGFYCVLVILADDSIDKDTRNIFFISLREYEYSQHTNEVRFKRPPITLNISALFQPEAIELEDLTKLFISSRKLRTYVRYLGEKRVHRLESDEIIGVPQGPKRPLDDVKACFVRDLEVGQGNVYPMFFSIPDGPPVVREGNTLRVRKDAHKS